MSRLGFLTEVEKEEENFKDRNMDFKLKNLRGDFQMTLNCDADRKIEANTENVVHVYQRPQLGMKMMLIFEGLLNT